MCFLGAGHNQIKMFRISCVRQIVRKIAFHFGIFLALMSTKSIKTFISGLTWFAGGTRTERFYCKLTVHIEFLEF